MFKKISVKLHLSSVTETKLNTKVCSFILSCITVITALQEVWDISFVLSSLNCMVFYLVLSVQTSQHRLPSVTVSLKPPGLIQSDAAVTSTEYTLLQMFQLYFYFLWRIGQILGSQIEYINCNSEEARLELKCFPVVLCQTGGWQRN